MESRTKNAEILIEKAAEAREGPLLASLLSIVSSGMQMANAKGQISDYSKKAQKVKVKVGKNVKTFGKTVGRTI